MSSRARPLAMVSAVAGALALMTTPVRAQIDRDTVATFTAPSCPPLMAADPDDGTLHVGYFDGVAFRHAWSDGGPWSNEVAVPAFTFPGGLFGIAWAAGPGGRLIVVYDPGTGELLCSIRDGGTWTPGVVVRNTGWRYAPAVAFDPVDHEPIVAIVGYDQTGVDPGLAHIELAHHTPLGWDVSEPDTVRGEVGGPGIAIDGHGEPRVALVRSPGPLGAPGGAYLLEAPSILGPYSWTLLDTLAAVGPYAGGAGIALDRLSEEPRVAYGAWRGAGMGTRYAARSAGVWALTTVSSGNDAPFGIPISIALTPPGDPRIVVTEMHNILAAGPEQAESCGGGVASPDVMCFERADGTGAGPFTAKVVAHWARSGPSAVLGYGHDGAHLAWRDPGNSTTTCPTSIIHAVDRPTTGVPATAIVARRLAVSPNPSRSGDRLSVALVVARPMEIELLLFDIAGRRVASTRARLDTGASSVTWSPGELRAGSYRVIARAGTTRLGSAPLIVLR